MKKEVKVEWCKNFIRAAFGPRHHAYAGSPDAGIEVNVFWRMAEASGLWERGTYGSPMSQALSELVEDEIVRDDKGNYAYTVFKLQKEELPQ